MRDLCYPANSKFLFFNLKDVFIFSNCFKFAGFQAKYANSVASFNPLTANDALPNYPSTAEAVNAVTYVKRSLACG